MRGEQGARGPLTPLETFSVFPITARASRTSEGLGWSGVEAARFKGSLDFEVDKPPLTHHKLVLFIRPPEELDLIYEGVNRHFPPRAGSIYLQPAGVPARVRSRRWQDSLLVYLEPAVVARVAAETFDLDAARLTVPPLDAADLPALRATMRAVDAELSAGGAGGRLAAESLANVLAVQLVRHVATPRSAARRRDAALPPRRLRAVVEYIEGHLDTGPTLEQLATVARLSAYHFARQFKMATGLPPHRYVIMRRVERAKWLLKGGGDLSLADVAVQAGFSDQSQFCQHFKRLVGVTPGQFGRPQESDNAPSHSSERPANRVEPGSFERL
jgi:AraC family transcriptional regulator